jgi:hypothetical protein
VRQIIGNQAE